MSLPFTLFPYQTTGVEFLLKSTRCVLADDMGIGKTVQTLEAIRVLGSDKEKLNVLIVAPAGLCLMWVKEIKTWIPDAQVIQLKEMKDTVALTGKYRFIVVSYNYLQKIEKLNRLLKMRWHVIACDESQAIKNSLSITCKNLMKILHQHRGKVWLLTGTPATRSGQDYYIFLKIVHPDRWGTLGQFSDRFCNYTVFGYSRQYQGVKASMKPVLRSAMSKIMLRRRKVEVLKELPPKLFKYLPTVIDSKIVGECLGVPRTVIENAILNSENPPAHIMTLLRAIGLGKVDAAYEYIKEVAVSEPIIVFCKHIDVLEKLREMLSKDFNVGSISGAESREVKQRNIDKFQNKEMDVILCNIKSGGVGHTLTASSHILFVEQDFSPAVMNQCIGRADRLGQVAECVNVTHLIAEGTFDEAIIEIRKRKESFIDYVAGDIL